MFSKLMDFAVELTVRGLDVVQKAMGDIKTAADGLEKGVNAIGAACDKVTAGMGAKIDAIGAKFKNGQKVLETALAEGQRRTEQMGAGMQAFATLSVLAFATASAAVGGWVRAAGLAASGVGQLLTFNLSQLSRAFAGLFGPELMKAIDLVQRLTAWIQSLSDAQKRNVARWIEGGLAVLGVLAALPRVLQMFNLVKLAISGVSAALAASGWGLIVLAIGAAVAALTLFLTGTEKGRSMIGGLAEAFKPVLDAVMSLFEAFMPIVEVFIVIMAQVAKLLAALAPLIAIQVRVLAFMTLISSAITAIALAPFFALVAVLALVAKAFEPMFNAANKVFAAIMEGFNAVQDAFAELTDAFSELFDALNDLMAPLMDELGQWLVSVIVPAIKNVAKEIADIARGVRMVMDAMGLVKRHKAEATGSRDTLAPQVGGPESMEQRFARLQAAALKTVRGKDPAEKTAEESEKHTNLLARIAGLLAAKGAVIKGLIGGN